MNIVANSIEDSITIAENVNEDFGKTLVYLWNEEMYWKHKSEFHLHLIEETKNNRSKINIKGTKL